MADNEPPATTLEIDDELFPLYDQTEEYLSDHSEMDDDDDEDDESEDYDSEQVTLIFFNVNVNDAYFYKILLLIHCNFYCSNINLF